MIWSTTVPSEPLEKIEGPHQPGQRECSAKSFADRLMVIAYEECQGEQVVDCKGPQPAGGSSEWEGSFDGIGYPLDDRQRGYEEE